MKRENLIEAIVRAVPYPNQITDWDLSGYLAVRFTWRGIRFRVSLEGYVEEIQGVFGVGNNISILMEKLIQHELNAKTWPIN